jgi:mono/diheme cytochrome c family protein
MFDSRVAVVLVSVWLAAGPAHAQIVASTPDRAQDEASRAASVPTVRASLNKYCVTCHNTRLKTGGLSLDAMDLENVAHGAEVWEKVVRKVRSGAMPPQGVSRPDRQTADSMVAWLETALDRAAAAAPSPGRPLVHRLNRVEYANAVRDLLAVDVDAAALLPPDDSIQGFDNIADALGVSPSLLEAYLAAAAKISALAVGDPSIGPTSQTFYVRGDASQTSHLEGLGLGTRGGLLVRQTFPLDGEYLFKVKLLQTNLGGVRGLEYEDQLEITVDGERVHLAPTGGVADYSASPDNATEVAMALDARLQARVRIAAGPRVVGASFLQKSAAEGGTRLQSFLRSTLIATDHTGLPHVESLTIAGPFNPTGPGMTPSRARIFQCRPPAGARNTEEAACAKKIVETLARRAFRRPVTASEVNRLLMFYQDGRRNGPFDRGIELAVRAVLTSPKFLVRVERDPESVAPGAVYRVGDLELASRLSFFLWSSFPDEELLTLAERHRLQDPAVVEQQVRRMLADPRAEALVSNFAGQWLYLRNVRTTTPDKNEFPDFDDNLRLAFLRETELFFGSIIGEDRNVLELLTADYTFVNERLARHYGIPNIYGSHFRRVAVHDEARKGLLGQGSILLVTSHADRTSPVVRGKWVLDNLLGAPPPPPPPDVPALKEKTDDDGTPHSLRERMEEHRANPACASCHKVMDPIGFALENFDAVGAWRTRDAGAAIDASGQLADGTPVNGVVTLREAVLKRPEIFVGTMTEKMLTYAVGRALSYEDMPAVRAIVRNASRTGYRFSSLVMGIVNSVPFQMKTKAPMATNSVRAQPVGDTPGEKSSPGSQPSLR